MSKKADKLQKKVAKLRQKYGRKQLEVVVCTDDRKGGCAERGAKAVYKALRRELVLQGADEEQVCLRACDHFGPCKFGPHIVITDGNHYSRVTPEDVPAIVQRLLAGEEVSDLLIETAA